MPEIIEIYNKKIGLGENAVVKLNIARLPTHTLIDLPVYIYRAPQDGPVLLLTACLHGDEINGLEIIRRMMIDSSLKLLKGTIIALPIVNVFGFIHLTRDLPDGKDLNRSFPGRKDGGSLASRVAYVMMNEIIPHIDYGIDFHTGGASRTNYPQIRCVADDPKNMELARAFAPSFIINAKLIAKSFRRAAYESGKYIIVYEGGESLRFDDLVIREGIEGTQRLMHWLGMINSSSVAEITVYIKSSSWLRARRSGIFRSHINYGDQVKRNEVIGSITDPYGESEFFIKSPVTGYIIGLNNLPVVNRGDALFHIGVAE